jgi:hypothetical protein
MLSGFGGQAHAAKSAMVPHIVVGNQFHSNVVTLVSLTGLRDELTRNRHAVAEQGKQEIRRSFPKYDPAFAEECARRMEKMPVDEYLNVVVQVYEKNYTNDDIMQMIQVQKDLSAAKEPVLSLQLRSKLAKVAETVETEINTGFEELGAKQGQQIGLQVAKDHPEWLSGGDAR